MTIKRPSGGYSLLEVMVVLAILAMTVSIVLPGLSVGLQAAARRTALMELDQGVLSLRRLAQTEGVGRTIGAMNGASDVPGGQATPAAEAALAGDLKLPAGWSYSLDHPLTFYPDGACDEGAITLIKAGAPSVRFEISMPECRPRLA